MTDKKVFVRNIRSWFSDWDTKNFTNQAPVKYVRRDDFKEEYKKYFEEVKPIDEHNPVYLFASQAWFYGINTAPLTNLKISRVSINTTKDKSASVVSIMPTDTVPTRKIVHRIRISCDKNIVAKHADMLEFTILRVKRSIYTAEATRNYKTNGLRNYSDADWTAFTLSPPLLGFENETI